MKNLTLAPRPGQHRSLRFPSARQTRAVGLGVNELHARLEFVLRDRPIALRNARTRYFRTCYSLWSYLLRGAREACPPKKRETAAA